MNDLRKKKGVRQIREFYLDFLYCPASTIPAGRVSSDTKSEILTRNMGFRMGWIWRSARTFGGIFRVEFGLLPGYIIPESDLYTTMTFGMNISGKVDPNNNKIYEYKK